MELDNWAPHIGWDDQLLLRLHNSGYSSYSQHGSHNHYSGHYNPGYNSWHHSADYSYYSGQQQQGYYGGSGHYPPHLYSHQGRPQPTVPYCRTAAHFQINPQLILGLT